MTLSNQFDGVRGEVISWIKKHAVRERILSMNLEEMKLVNQGMKAELRKIEAYLKKLNVKITAHYEDDIGFHNSGTSEGLVQAKKPLKKCLGKLIRDEHTIATPGMPYYFEQHPGDRGLIKTLQDKYNVAIHTKEIKEKRKPDTWPRRITREEPIHSRPIAGTMPKPVPKPKPKPKQRPRIVTKELKQVTHPSGVVIKAFIMDMTTDAVDVIANTANRDLKHIGGLAKAILDKGKWWCANKNSYHFNGKKSQSLF